jgi:hypothetical protein
MASTPRFSTRAPTALHSRKGFPTARALGPGTLFGLLLPVEIQLNRRQCLPSLKRALPAHPRSPFHPAVLLIQARCDRSPLHGLGLFSMAAIQAGTPVWRFTPGFDQTFTQRQFEQLPEPARLHLLHYGSFDARADHWILNGDLSVFMNHSDSPNTGAPDRPGGAATVTVALRDIQAGEEITCDYRAFDASSKPIPPAQPPE